jgi:FKBP-type peptidyl-prolyl cis-trans isomerases 1
MKLKSLIPALVLVLGLTAASRAQDNSATPAAQPSAAPAASFTDEQVAEQLGWMLGRQSGLRELDFSEAEVEAVIKGLRAAAAGEDSPQDLEAIRGSFEEFMRKKQTTYLGRMREQSTTEGAAFMAEMQKRSGVVVLPSGLAYEIEAQGSGASPKPEDVVRVHYTGRLVNGTVFDSSLERGEPIDIRLNEVIPGWTEGLQKISKGGKMKLYIPPQLAYGENGQGEIPPAATLVFDVELLDINPADAQQ